MPKGDLQAQDFSSFPSRPWRHTAKKMSVCAQWFRFSILRAPSLLLVACTQSTQLTQALTDLQCRYVLPSKRPDHGKPGPYLQALLICSCGCGCAQLKPGVGVRCGAQL